MTRHAWLLRQSLCAAFFASSAVILFPRCGFPGHDFIDDADFYGTGSDASVDDGAPSSQGGASGDGATSTGGSRDAGEQCGSGEVECAPGLCVRPLSDPDHCGGCEQACADGEVCSEGDCKPSCAEHLTNCDGECVDTDSEGLHCGDCDVACSAREICEAGKCVAGCGSLADCDSTCTDIETDRAHCGRCNRACSDEESCVDGECVVLQEDCENGDDDDEDSLVDCEDPDCTSGYTCVALPSGWSGPIAFWSGARGSPPGCGEAGGYSSSALTAYRELEVPAYSCPDCECRPSEGSSCIGLGFYFSASNSCAAGEQTWPIRNIPTNGTCQSLQLARTVDNTVVGSVNSSRLIETPDSYARGTCEPHQDEPEFPATTWATEARGCASSKNGGGGCTAGQCRPKPRAPFEEVLCIFRSGNASCPPDYPSRRPGTNATYFQTVDEGRSCSCECDKPTCGGTVNTYTTLDCQGEATPLDLDGECSDVPTDPTPGGSDTIDTRSVQWEGATAVCGTGTKTLQGAPTPESPITVCCQDP